MAESDELDKRLRDLKRQESASGSQQPSAAGMPVGYPGPQQPPPSPTPDPAPPAVQPTDDKDGRTGWDASRALILSGVLAAGVWLLFAMLPFLGALSGGAGAFVAAFLASVVTAYIVRRSD